MHFLEMKWIMASVLVASLGYIGYRVAAYNNVIIVTRNAQSVDVGVEPLVTDSPTCLSLIVVGDTGKDTPERTKVIESMREHAKRSLPDAAVLLGDNFYESGVKSIDDPRFESDFEELFASDSFGFPFYVCLGNHDHSGDVEAQVEYTQRSSRWKMPSRYYEERMHAGDETIDLFVLDSVPIHSGQADASVQIQWLEERLAASNATWKIVSGHHPAITGGRHDVSDAINSALPPLFEKYGVDVYLSGHDHDLQLNDSGRGWMQVVSGSGSKLRSTNWIAETVFAKATPGFCWVLIGEGRLSMSFYSTDKRLYTHTIVKPANASSPRSTKGNQNSVLN